MEPHDVSRETPSTPEAARRAFPSARLTLAERYAELLATEGVLRGLIGPREAPRLWDRHLVNCALLAELIPPDATVADIGSGAGLPGLVLAIARPDVRITLVEPLLRRTTFLTEVAEELDLTHVEVFRGRADALHGTRTFNVVTSRAVAPLDRLLGWSMPLVAPTGALVAMKGSSITDEIEAARTDLERWGCAEPEVHVLGEGLAESTTLAVRVAWADPTRVSWPLAVDAPTRKSPGRARPSGKRRRRT
ncbi:16S rRNA (guanine(527)-N(7))-methyltransferase RsmG [Nocardioides sp. CN2-186]|uniref:16S rRNA (guanine(527)-N(7))-methyltransferase RsmG n=1 Tax=Nocardioides tweenelious TaxID=3156607 RepID=UPI0032B5DB1C